MTPVAIAWTLLACQSPPADTGLDALARLGDTAVTLLPCEADRRAFLEDIITAGLHFSEDGSCPGGVRYRFHSWVSLSGCLEHSEDGFVSLGDSEAYSPAPLWYGGAEDGIDSMYVVHRADLGQTYGQLWLSSAMASEADSCRLLAIGPGTD